MFLFLNKSQLSKSHFLSYIHVRHILQFKYINQISFSSFAEEKL